MTLLRLRRFAVVVRKPLICRMRWFSAAVAAAVCGGSEKAKEINLRRSMRWLRWSVVSPYGREAPWARLFRRR